MYLWWAHKLMRKQNNNATLLCFVEWPISYIKKNVPFYVYQSVKSNTIEWTKHSNFDYIFGGQTNIKKKIEAKSISSCLRVLMLGWFHSISVNPSQMKMVVQFFLFFSLCVCFSSLPFFNHHHFNLIEANMTFFLDFFRFNKLNSAIELSVWSKQ